MERWKGKLALVTGASSGIGFAIAQTLAKNGVNVVGCARNIAKIEELSKTSQGGNNGKVTAIKCDLNNENDILAMFKEIEKLYGHLDILINNAGLGHMAPLISGKTKDWQEMINVNIIAVSICAREALKLMADVESGHIINVNSMGGHQIPTGSDFDFYSGTKHMLVALSKALYKEAKASLGNKIRVTNFSPGAVDTDFINRASASTKKEGSDTAKPEQAHKEWHNWKSLTSQDCADAMMYALNAPQHVCVREIILAPTEQPTNLLG